MMVKTLRVKRWLRTILLSMLVMVGITVAVVFYFFATFDIETQRLKIMSMISQSLDREVRIDGKLDSFESTFESEERTVNDIILNGRTSLSAKEGEVHWQSINEQQLKIYYIFHSPNNQED